jgi:hypothetical protein
LGSSGLYSYPAKAVNSSGLLNSLALAFAHYLHGDTTRWVDYTTHNTAISELCLSSSELLSFNDTEHLGDE